MSKMDRLIDHLIERDGLYYEGNSQIPYTGIAVRYYAEEGTRNVKKYIEGVEDRSWGSTTSFSLDPSKKIFPYTAFGADLEGGNFFEDGVIRDGTLYTMPGDYGW
tara:strand:- start:209 stop:523 length:315 start_codon:yes stop_codon:yes gene_type:complete